MKQCTNPSSSSTDGAAENHAATVRPKASKMTATTTTTITSGTATSTATTTMPGNARSKHTSTSTGSAREPKDDSKTSASKSTSSELHPLKQQQQYLLHPAHHYPLHHHQLGAKMGGGGKLGAAAGVDSLSALHMLPAHLRDMFLAQLLRGYYQPAGPLISPHLLGQPPTAQHGPKSGPDGDTLLAGPPQPPASSTADSTDSDVLLTGTPGRPADDLPMGFHPLRPRAAVAAAAAAADDADRYFRSVFAGGGADPAHRTHPYGSSRYGPTAGVGGAGGSGGGAPPANLYPRPMQMHCPPATYLPPGYYAPSPYGPQPPPPHGPPPEMYYTHAYPAHFYPKFAPPYYPTTRRYYTGPPGPGPEHHMYEQAPPPTSAQGPPGPGPPPPPPSGAQLVPAGPQGPQHLEHYPYPPYPGYGSPGPGSGGQCYSRNLQHPPPPPPYMGKPMYDSERIHHHLASEYVSVLSCVCSCADAHYTTNCPCPMQCPKNVNAGSLIGIKASKGPVATNNHIVQNQTTSARMSLPEPITISSSSSSASSSSSPAPVDIHSPVSAAAVAAAVTTTATTVASQPTVGNIEPVASTMAAAKQQPPHLSQHGYHAHHHHGAQPMELHPSANHVLAHPYQYHYHHPGYGPSLPPAEVPQKPAVTSTSTAAVTTSSAIAKQQPPAAVVTTAGSDHPEKMCYKTEQLIKPEAPGELHPTPMHYASPYHHYQYPMGYYHPPHHHHAKLPDLKEEPHGTLTPPYSITSKMALLDTAEMSPARLSSSADGHPAKVSDCGDKVRGAEADDKLTNIPVSTIVKQEIEEFKLLEPLVGTICKKEDFEETGPAMTPDLLDEAIVIKRDRDEVKLATSPAFEHHLQQRHLQHHHLHHHHSASTNLLHGPPHHHQLHSRYSSMQQQQKPLITGLLVEKDDGESDAKLPPDSKSLLTKLVLTTEASMVEPPEAATTTTTAKSTTLEVELLSRVDAAAQQQAGGTSSDSSLSLSDSLTPRTAAGAAEQLNRISKDTVEQVQSHDSGLDPPSPVPIPASTVKRRPLLVACKKPTPKQSPPNSYKNLIKRTNGGVSDAEDAREPECPEPVELSEEEEEEEDDEEEEEEEEEDDEEEEEDDEEEDTEALLEKDVEDVEDIELQEQRKVEAEKRALLDVSRASQESAGRKQHIRKRAVSKRKPASNVRKFPSTSGTPQDKLHRKQQSLVSKKWASSKAVARSAKRLHRVFRSNIESLKRLPAALRERLLRRSNITFVPIRRTVRKRLNRSQLVLETAEHENSEMPESITDRADEMGLSKLNDTEPTPLPPTELAIPTDASKVAESCSGVTSSTSPTSNVTIPPLSNVDRTIDLVAKGYFSEPEILTCPERTWLKKLKQQQEGRSLSEQSRGAAAKRTGEGTSKKCKAKCSLEMPTPNAVAPVPSEKCKKSKSKSKSSKAVAVPVSDIEPEEPVPKSSKTATEGKKSKSKKKANAKERKKSEPSSRKRKQKEQPDEEEVSHAPNRKRSSKEQDSLAVKTGEALYLRATSTPIPPSAGEMLPVPGQVDRELSDAADRKAGGVLDDSVVTLMDQSSVIDDRETDFDDAATMLVEDDVASVDTSVLINRHHHNNNNNNNSAITDKNNLAEEQQRVDQIVLAAPLQAIIAEGKEGSELEPPEGMEPFMDEQLDEDEAIAASQLQVTVRQSVEVVQPVAPSMDLPLDPVHATYDDEYEELEEEELQPKRGSSRSVKRRRSRSKTKSKKFSTKKRHRPSLRAEQQLLQEIIVPKRCTTIPRWSNGWTWEGQPFQGKVFLNSDDPPVLRTCYPAMRHSVGDIIKPRDCVLLKAGSKRAELPYVAKVAHLWENPDDGEMMMSLLWYYRPEHTEQGRQRTDGPDEVFASRHKDHNSVACIEDKCYVLTFSEYCRFRRQLKGYEENIEEQPSIVPPLRRENPRLPPPIVSPELVMYCQRVYEFRQKRLLKSTS
uniref:BAH domain-containing protein n=1 Tax=Anopheles dirus TaxID=7168 RepID=A0A1Y9H217_9DIPT